MSLAAEWIFRDGHLFVRLRGPVSADAMRELADEIARRCGPDASGVPRATAALLDCKALTGALPLSELLAVGAHFATTLSGVRLAAIHMPAHWTANRFSEDVIHNRGGVLRHFQTEADAVAWLSR